MNESAEYRIVSARDEAQFEELWEAFESAGGPKFLNHDATVNRYWSGLRTVFPDHQFCMVEQATGIPVGIGNSIPVHFEGGWSELPAGGLDWVLEWGFLGREAGLTPTIMSALYIVVSDSYRGKALSQRMLGAMKQIGREQGFEYLIAPVRPWMKSRYPLIDMETYVSWKDANGNTLDPWLRVHVQVGGEVLHPCSRAMTVRGSRQEWAAWTGMAFPGDGRFVIPHGLVPVEVRGEVGEYIEPGIWVLHRLN